MLITFEETFIFLNSMYGMTNSGELFADELTEWLIEAGFIKPQWQMSIYYKYAPGGTKIVVLSYVDDCVYWYTSEALGKKIGCSRKDIPYEILGICTLVHVNNNFLDEESFCF